MNERISLDNSLKEKYGPLYSINEVAECLHVKRPHTIWKMTFVSRRDDKRDNKMHNYVEKYIEGDNLYGLYSGNNKIMITESSIKKYIQNHVMRNPLRDRKIIKNARNSLLILGINGLGPLHQNRELIVRLLKNKGAVKVLLLDPRSDSFEERVNFEKCFEDQQTNRLIYEFLASFGLCKEISECCEAKTDFILKLYSSKPKMSLVITDFEDENGVLNLNSYPKIKGSRGMAGGAFQMNKINDKEHFGDLVEEYIKMFDDADQVDLNVNPTKYLKNNPLIDNYDINE
ncbi:MAG: hypothetical protein PHG64_15090 [Paludibacter sp.]|nr:hypothetical protein [Paludibacter sp.]